MKKKGQMNGLGILLLTFVTVLVGVILFQVIEQQVGESTTLEALTNTSIGTVTNGTAYYFTEYRALSDVVVYNDSGQLRNSANYTIANNVINPTTSALATSLTPSSEFTGESWNVTATGQPLTYISDSGGRSLASIIGILFALAVLVVALVPTLKNEFMSMIGR